MFSGSPPSVEGVHRALSFPLPLPLPLTPSLGAAKRTVNGTEDCALIEDGGFPILGYSPVQLMDVAVVPRFLTSLSYLQAAGS